MRPNLIIMLAFLIFLVGFFSSQIALTGQATRDSFFSSLTDAELARYGDLTVEDCRVTSLLSGYGARARQFDTSQGRTYDPEHPFTTKSTYQLGYYDPAYDFDNNHKIDGIDSKFCYDVVNRRGEFSRSPSHLQSPAFMSGCTTPGATKCLDDAVVVCTPDPDSRGSYQWVVQSRAGKAQECRKGIIQSLVVTKPWLHSP